MKKILDIKNLTIDFNTYAGRIQAVRNISFSLYEGEILAIVGESGCGKTVTSKSIMRLLPEPTAQVNNHSEIIFDGQNVLKLKGKELKKIRGDEIAMIFQDPMSSLNPTMKVGHQVAESLLIHTKISKKQAFKEAVQMLKLVGLPMAEKRAHEYPNQYSGGMRQRAMIAIALACKPKILIADEPTTALDVTIQAQIMKLIKTLQADLNTAIILVTHDLGIVAGMADRIQVMYAGQIIERGVREELFYDPQHPYTWALLRSVPKLSQKSKSQLYSITGTPPDLLYPPKGCAFAARCEYCMPICRKESPAETIISNTQSVNCWLQHKDAPKMNKPSGLKGVIHGQSL